jgi:hypothetical protein
MPRYDKYEPYAGGFRAPLAEALPAADRLTMYAVGLDSAGRVVLGGGQTGVLGAFIAHKAKNAGDIVDVMTQGEIVQFTDQAGADIPAGTVIYGATDGSYGTAAGGTRLGHTVEGSRLVVRVVPAVTGGV